MGGIVLVTGSSGFIGAPLCVDLARDHPVVGVDCRPPSPHQVRAAPGVRWVQADIAEGAPLRDLFLREARRGGGLAAVIHLAAFYHFGRRWRPEYARVNLEGTRHVVRAAAAAGAERLVFAGSIAALAPDPYGRPLTEGAATMEDVAYARSKALGEALLAECAGDLPWVTIRMGGVFTDWCELPPLFSLIRTWRRPGPAGRLMPGRGGAGFPYIRRGDLLEMIGRVVEGRHRLAPRETLFAAPEGGTLQRELYPLIRGAGGRRVKPWIPVPAGLLRVMLQLTAIQGRLRRQVVYERPWMADYVDRPLLVDTAYTRRRLDWAPAPENHILARLPVIMERCRRQPEAWLARNLRRNRGLYTFQTGDEAA